MKYFDHNMNIKIMKITLRYDATNAPANESTPLVMDLVNKGVFLR